MLLFCKLFLTFESLERFLQKKENKIKNANSIGTKIWTLNKWNSVVSILLLFVLCKYNFLLVYAYKFLLVTLCSMKNASNLIFIENLGNFPNRTKQRSNCKFNRMYGSEYFMWNILQEAKKTLHTLLECGWNTR